jgi:hypothetical protein
MYRRVRSSARNIRFPEVAMGAKCLKILKKGKTAFAPCGYVVDVKLDPRVKGGARSASAAAKAITF